MSAVVTTAALKTASVTSWAIAVLIVTAIGRTARARIGGVTGDVFGASVELTETSVLLGGVLLTGRP
jgi:cobalamin synthase